jgi:hypothetical protein
VLFMTASTAPQAKKELDVGAVAQAAPRAPPQREDRRGRRDPHPRHPEHVDAGEQQHGEGRPEVVEDRADHEVGLGRGRLDEAAADVG